MARNTDQTNLPSVEQCDEDPRSYFQHIGYGVYRIRGKDNGARFTKDAAGNFLRMNTKNRTPTPQTFNENGGYKRKRKPLAPKHHKAVEYYMQGCSKTEALRRAGYAESTAEHAQYLIFGREDVQKEIERRQWATRTKTNVIQDRIMEELQNIAFFNIGNFIEITDDGQLVFSYDGADFADFAAIGEITVETYKEGRGEDAETVKRVKVKPYDKQNALLTLARIHGMLHDNLHVTDETNLEERLQAGRNRIKSRDRSKAVDVDFEEVE